MRGLLVVVGLFGCAGITAPPDAPVAVEHHPIGAPLVVPGEQMVFEITFRGLHVGNVAVAIGKSGWLDGRPAVIIRSQGSTDGLLALIGDLDWQLATTIDLETGLPLSSTEDAKVTLAGKTETSHHDRGADSTHTVHSAATAMRGWRSAPGQEDRFRIHIDDATLDVVLHEAGHEWLAAADKPAVRYAGSAQSKFPFEIWFSDDAARVPLLLKASTKWGAVQVLLVEYTPPRD